jgi:hypothetical protein
VIQRIMTKATLIAFACTASIAVSAYAIDRKPIEIPAGELATALRTLAAQAGVEFFYQSDLVTGLRTQGVSGVLSPEEAVTKLLEGTALTLQTDSSGAILIVRPAVGPAATLSPKAVIWATGFALDHSFVQATVSGADGRLVHLRGVTEVPGLYFLGLPWQYTRGSALLGWVKDDAEFIAQQINAFRPRAVHGADTRQGVQADTTGRTT